MKKFYFKNKYLESIMLYLDGTVFEIIQMKNIFILLTSDIEKIENMLILNKSIKTCYDDWS